MPARLDLQGKSFGRLTVIGIEPGDDRAKRRWICLCSCGNQTLTLTADLTSGKSTKCRKCGVKKHGATKSGGTRTPTYSSWNSMRQRCNNPNAAHYARYGGRGITVDPRWDSYEQFLADMGERPSLAYTIGRIDNDMGYSPENCKWETRWEQTRPGRRNK